MQVAKAFDIDSIKATEKGLPTVNLTKTSSAQNYCFWKGQASPQGLEVSWGVVGTNGQSRFFDKSHCLGGNPAKELEKRCREKLLKSYSFDYYDTL